MTTMTDESKTKEANEDPATVPQLIEENNMLSVVLRFKFIICLNRV